MTITDRIICFLTAQLWTFKEINDWFRRPIDTMGGNPRQIIARGDGERLWSAMVLPDGTMAGGNYRRLMRGQEGSVEE